MEVSGISICVFSFTSFAYYFLVGSCFLSPCRRGPPFPAGNFVWNSTTGWNVFNQDALFKGYKKRLDKLPKAKAGSESARMVCEQTLHVDLSMELVFHLHREVFVIIYDGPLDFVACDLANRCLESRRTFRVLLYGRCGWSIASLYLRSETGVSHVYSTGPLDFQLGGILERLPHPLCSRGLDSGRCGDVAAEVGGLCLNQALPSEKRRFSLLSFRAM